MILPGRGLGSWDWELVLKGPGQPPRHSATSDDFLNLSGSQFVLLQDRNSHVCLLSWRFVEATCLSWGYVRLVDYKRLQLDTI